MGNLRTAVQQAGVRGGQLCPNSWQHLFIPWLTRQPPCDLSVRAVNVAGPCRFHPTACVKGHEMLKPITPPFGHFSPQQENRCFLSFFFNRFHDAMPIFKQSIKPYTLRGQINLQCIIRISLRWCVSLKMMSKWFHESFRLKPLSYTPSFFCICGDFHPFVHSTTKHDFPSQWKDGQLGWKGRLFHGATGAL